MLKLIKRTKIWHITGSIRGVRYRETTGTSSLCHAEAILAKRQIEILDRATWGPKRIAGFAEAVTLYLQQGGEARFVHPLLARWGKWRIAEITQTDVVRAAHEIYPGRSAAYHIRAVFTPTSAILRCAARAGLCEITIFDKPKLKRKPIEYASDDWFHRVLPCCGDPLAAILTFMTLTGARVAEACALLWCDVDLSNSQALLRTTKNGSPRLVDLAEPVVTSLKHLGRLGVQPYGTVFGYAGRWSVNQAIRRACKRAGAPYLSSHKAGRHAFAARLLRAGHSIKLVQEAGGWRVARIVSDHYGHLERSHVSAAIKASGTNLTRPALAARAATSKGSQSMVGATGIEPVTPTMSR